MISAIIEHVVGPIVRYWLREKDRQNQSILTFGQEVALRTCNGTYVQANLNDDAVLVARERHVLEWEIFEIVDANEAFSYSTDKPIRYGDRIAFRAKNNGNFVGVSYDNSQRELFARVPWVKEWETFILISSSNNYRSRRGKPVHFGHFCAFRAYNGEYVMYDRDRSSRLYAVASHIKEWETFVCINPSQPK